MNPSVDLIVKEALAHQHAGRMQVALGLFRRVLQQDPRNPQANYSLGIAAYLNGDLGVAIELLRVAERRASRLPQVHQLLGLALLNAGDLAGAQKSLKKAVALAPKEADFHSHLGDLYRLRRQPALARQSYERSLAIDPGNGYALVGLGQLEITIGDIEAAVVWFQQAIDGGKELPTALHLLTGTRTYKERPVELDTIEGLLSQDVPRAAPDQANLHWAAGKVYYDLGDTQRTVHHFRTARQLRYPPFDRKAHEERISFMKEVFNEKFFAERQEVQDSSERPVFIFGMPRSGTTLAEQIICRHSRIASGAELSYFRQLQQDLGLRDAPSAALETRLKNLGPKDYQRFARSYLAELNQIDRRADRVTDKMPHNFEMLWMMSLLFPKATFIHCVRCPADTCISLLSHSLSPSHNYCLSQETLGRYFQTYADLMEHWAKVLPVKLPQLSYEELVHNQERESRTLLAQTGMDWEDDCLQFYQGDSPVTTFSNLQVRRPMFRSSIGRWRRYKDLLKELFVALGPLAPTMTDGAAGLLAGHEERPNLPDNDVARQQQVFQQGQ